MRNLRRKSIHNESSPSSYLCIILLRSWWLILRHTPSSIIHCLAYHFFYNHLLLGILELYPKWIIKWCICKYFLKKEIFNFQSFFGGSIRLLCFGMKFRNYLFIDFNLAERCHWKAAPTFFSFLSQPQQHIFAIHHKHRILYKSLK